MSYRTISKYVFFVIRRLGMHCDGIAIGRIVDEKASNHEILIESCSTDNGFAVNRIDLSSEQHKGNNMYSYSNRWHPRYHISHRIERGYCGKYIPARRCWLVWWLQWWRCQQYDHEIQRFHHLYGIQEDTRRWTLVREQRRTFVFIVKSIAQTNWPPRVAGISQC